MQTLTPNGVGRTAVPAGSEERGLKNLQDQKKKALMNLQDQKNEVPMNEDQMNEIQRSEIFQVLRYGLHNYFKTEPFDPMWAEAEEIDSLADDWKSGRNSKLLRPNIKWPKPNLK
ncbi:hypothetical protein M0R45_019985 [Rubus argutus]|uniref:Uncharacterized protein n=1 Tax=Rubus argutus TaxID=59490 RepID=A0AAW1X8Q1_RUBAR